MWGSQMMGNYAKQAVVGGVGGYRAAGRALGAAGRTAAMGAGAGAV
jgi:hypothetical protein